MGTRLACGVTPEVSRDALRRKTGNVNYEQGESMSGGSGAQRPLAAGYRKVVLLFKANSITVMHIYLAPVDLINPP